MVCIWRSFWLLQHAMFARPGFNLARLCNPSGPIQGAKVIACRFTTNGFIGKRMRPYCKLETEQERCTIVKQFLWIFYESKSAIFQTYCTRNCALIYSLSKLVYNPPISTSVQKL